MANTTFQPPTVDEFGRSILDSLDEYDTDVPAVLPSVSSGKANRQHVVFVGMGFPTACCESPVMVAIEHEQELDITGYDQQRCPSPLPTPIHTPYFSRLSRASTRDTYSGPPVEHQPGTLGLFANTRLDMLQDQQPARATPSALQASQALQALASARYTRSEIKQNLPLTAPDTLPRTTIDWAMNHSYVPGVARSVNAPIRDTGPFLPTFKSPVTPITSHTDQARPFECRHRPCKENGKIATFKKSNDRNKHEKRVHCPKGDRPHACQFCGAKFNHPRERRRHVNALHNDEPATAVCFLCQSSFKHRPDHLDRHLKDAHPQERSDYQEFRKSSTSVGNGREATAPISPSTMSETLETCFDLLTPPPSRRSFRSELVPLPTSSSSSSTLQGF